MLNHPFSQTVPHLSFGGIGHLFRAASIHPEYKTAGCKRRINQLHFQTFLRSMILNPHCKKGTALALKRGQPLHCVKCLTGDVF